MYPCATSQEFMNPDSDNHLRQALLGCNGKGVGTVNEAEMDVHVWDAAQALSIEDATVGEGDAGMTTLTFTATLGQ